MINIIVHHRFIDVGKTHNYHEYRELIMREQHHQLRDFDDNWQSSLNAVHEVRTPRNSIKNGLRSEITLAVVTVRYTE